MSLYSYALAAARPTQPGEAADLRGCVHTPAMTILAHTGALVALSLDKARVDVARICENQFPPAMGYVGHTTAVFEVPQWALDQLGKGSP